MGIVGLTKDPCLPKDRFITVRIYSTTHNLLMNVCVLDDVVRVPSPVRSPIGGHVELRLDKGHCGVLEAKLCTGGERVVDPVHTEGLKSSTRQLHVGTQHRECWVPRRKTRGGSSRWSCRPLPRAPASSCASGSPRRGEQRPPMQA